MRIRTVKPEFWQNEDLARISAPAKLLAIGLLNVADDEGYFKYSPLVIRGQLFPFNQVDIHVLLSELSLIGYIQVYESSNGSKYALVTNFLEHQKINRPTASKIACLTLTRIEVLCDSTEIEKWNHGLISEYSLPERKGKEGKGMEFTSAENSSEGIGSSEKKNGET